MNRSSVDNFLLSLVEDIAQNDGDYPTEIPVLSIYRRSTVTDPMPCVFGLGLGVTLQGRKRVTLGEDVFDYGSGQALINTIDLPVVSYVTQATITEPYLGLRLDLDANLIVQIATEMNASRIYKGGPSRAMSVIALDDGLLDALMRLIKLLNEPNKIPFIAPLIQREIIIRLLDGEHGPMLQHLAAVGSPSQQISQVIAWMKLNYTNTILIDELAAKAHMSSSTFRQHFRSLTGLSPLQYLKNLRLQDARHWMLYEDMDAGSAAIRVGYESVSQFNREYARMFGEPPLRDIKRMRNLSN
ncbi:AraC family transcriptional regulator [Acinetobacter sp. AOR15_HL]|uniref:AraC family transcriptional regulator n=1 Tax=unclassified Acinetobacter TaxID=196816 RepID=UPI0022EAFCBD|nr:MULTISPECIES: AraC family transcriptional regulator [unclassified Acinetobacter]MDA3557683.1 AraC family transcriptional regulator [Acinetobacter sp. AOR15_HL]MDA3570974.1 AraC family transcriptional regulator [Acinetobacter sp. AOR14_HL]